MKFRPVRLVLLVAIIAAPVLLGALPLMAQPDPSGDLDRVPAAVVNLDEPIQVKGPDGKQQTVAAGRQLAADLSEGSGDNFDWQLTDRADARNGLRDGTYAAVVTIPDGFSDTVSSTSGKHPERAELRVRSNDANSYLAGQIADSLATASAESLGDTVSEQYLDTVYTGFNQLHKETGKAAGGARDVADGASDLAKGADDAGKGADQLANGVGQLEGGADELASGTSQVADGAGQLSSSARDLSDGMGELRRKTDALPDQTAKLASGSTGVASGANELSAGTSDVAAGNQQLSAALDQLAAACSTAALPPYCEQVEKVKQSSHQLADGAQRTADGASDLAGGADRVAGGTRELADSAPALQNGIAQAADGSTKLADGASQLANGARRTDEGATELASASAELDSGARQVADGTRQLADGSSDLADGSDELFAGMRDGAKSVPTYDKDQRERSAGVVSEPVTTTLDRTNAGTLADSLAPVVLPIALWTGAMAIFFVLAPLSRTALSTTLSSWRIAVRGLGPAAALAAAQAVVLILAVAWFGVEVANPLAATGVAVLAAISFVAVQQWLVAAFGRVGVLVSLAVLALQAAAVGWFLFAGASGGLSGLAPFLPATYAADGLRIPMLGGDAGTVWSAVAMLVLLGLAGFGLTVRAIRRRRGWTLQADVPVPVR